MFGSAMAEITRSRRVSRASVTLAPARCSDLLAPVPARDLPAIERLKELLLVACDQIDQLLIQRLFLGERFGLPDGLLAHRRCCVRACDIMLRSIAAASFSTLSRIT